MGDIQIAYYLIVIMVGFAALVVAGFQALKIQDSDLKKFCILYASFLLEDSSNKRRNFNKVEQLSIETVFFLYYSATSTRLRPFCLA